MTADHVFVEKILVDMIHPNVSNLPGLLLQVVLAVHDVVNVNSHVRNVVRLVESITTFMSTTITTAFNILEN